MSAALQIEAVEQMGFIAVAHNDVLSKAIP
jgi:hypothetical protein